ncbi:MAG: HDOD domain-containing protein [Pseudomonadota bacterium]
MWGPLRNWFGKARTVNAPAVPRMPEPVPQREVVSVALPVVAPGPEPLPVFDRALDCRFSALLLSLRTLREAEFAPAEKVVIIQLDELLHIRGNRELLPRLPAVLPKLMSLVRRDDVSPRELVAHLARDPALVSEVIRIANSPRYRASRSMGSLQDAVMVLGQRGMHQLVTNVAMRPVFNMEMGRFSRAARAHLWEQASRCAHACSYLRGGRSDQFDAYLAGMVVNAGLIPALRVLDQNYVGCSAPDTVAFHEAFLKLSLRISANIAKEWNFPEGVSQAVEALSAEPKVAASVHLAAELRAADQVSKRHLLATTNAMAPAGGEDDADPCFQELDRVFGGGRESLRDEPVRAI